MEGATVTLPKSDGRFRLVQVIDANGYTTDVLYDEGTYEFKSSSGAKYVYLFMRTAADPEDKTDQDAARKMMQNTTIESKGNRPFVSEFNFNTDEIVAMREKIIKEGGKKYTDSFGSFGDVDDIKDHEKFVYGAAAGWGGLPDKDAVYGRLPQTSATSAPFSQSTHRRSIDTGRSPFMTRSVGWRTKSRSGIPTTPSRTRMALSPHSFSFSLTYGIQAIYLLI